MPPIHAVPLLHLQGYNLDYMSNEDLGELIGSLTQVGGQKCTLAASQASDSVCVRCGGAPTTAPLLPPVLRAHPLCARVPTFAGGGARAHHGAAAAPGLQEGRRRGGRAGAQVRGGVEERVWAVDGPGMVCRATRLALHQLLQPLASDFLGLLTHKRDRCLLPARAA